MFTIDAFVLGLEKVFSRYTVEYIPSDCVRVTYGHSDQQNYETLERDVLLELSVLDIQDNMQSIPQGWAIKELFAHNKTKCEVLVKPVNQRMPLYHIWDRDLHKIDSNNYSFVISKSSIAYCIALICNIATIDNVDIEGIVSWRPRPSDTIRSFEGLLQYLRWFTIKGTLPIGVSNEETLSEFRKMTQSYLFNICYNNGTVFSIPDLHTSRREMRYYTRREGQLFPYRKYNQSLVTYYYQGLSSDIPFARYLAFYHVPEFFFQIVAEDDAFKEIEDFITRPSFSPRKKEDIRTFYKKVRKIMNTQKENDVWDEKVGFLLCLKKYVPDLDTLKNAIDKLDNSALDYYKSKEVSFSDSGCTINFDATPENVYANIRNRVYSVRNAIVHSKEGERLKYEPFKHDRELAKEIPLIQAIAEEIIINSSKPIDVRTQR